ncbi:MAG: glycosyltransferase family 4 protein [Gammaproteobacteria bacterium]|nr:glycosyltransferase family 4 protein [Gammaproteobacteria bacterium]
MRRLKIFTWHVHGAYLYYLSHLPHDIYVPYRADRSADYSGKWGHIPWPDNLHDIAAEDVRNLDLDCIIFQLPKHYLSDQHEILSEIQRRKARIFLQHDPPYEHPTDTPHWVNDAEILLVHVTPFNDLMWNSQNCPTRVIDHGVVVPESVRYSGEQARGLVVVNNLASRGRLIGLDIFKQVRREIPLDLIGMGAECIGGLGEVQHKDIPAFAAKYRFFFNPIRYTSLGLAVCEAMMIGMPIVGLATTEMATAVQNGISGYIDTNVDKLIGRMRELLNDPAKAKVLGDGARRYALKRFNIQRFIDDWNEALYFACQRNQPLMDRTARASA